MPFYLVPWVGSGSESDPYLPSGAGQVSTWTVVDLRPDSSQAAGYGLLWTEQTISPPDGVELPDLDSALSGRQANGVADALGIDRGSVRGLTTRGLVGASVTSLASAIGVKPARPERDGVRRARMRGVVWDEERDG